LGQKKGRFLAKAAGEWIPHPGGGERKPKIPV